jgi:predicted flap endonuclease-1-like 5' DNA nuclease
VNIVDVEGIGPVYAQKLEAAGVATTDELLERGARPRGREDLAAATGIPGSLVLEWVNQVDLMRISGVGSQYADLLSRAGVDSPLELARRNPANLAGTFAEIDAARPDEVRRVPSEQTVADWVEQAKQLSRAVFHEDGPASAGSSAAQPAAAEETARATEAAVPADVPAATAGAPATAAPAATAEPPAPDARTSAAATARPLASPTPAAGGRTGLWARIKRAIGMG